MSFLDGYVPAQEGRTTYGFPVGHIFGIWAPDEKLFEVEGCDEHLIEFHPVDKPASKQTMSQAEFRQLVKAGSVDPRIQQNSDSRRRLAVLNSDIQYLGDAPEEERAALTFYTRLCRRIEKDYDDGKVKKTAKALERHIPRVARELRGLPPVDENDDDQPGSGADTSKGQEGTAPNRKSSRRGRNKATPVATSESGPSKAAPVVKKQRRIRARKTGVMFEEPSPSTLKRWIVQLKEHNWDEVALRDRRKNRSGNRAPRITDARSLSIMAHWVMAFCCRSRPSRVMLWRLMVGSVDFDTVNARLDARGADPIPRHNHATFAGVNAERKQHGRPPLPIPSLSTFERAVRKLDKYQVCVARWGIGEARRRFGSAGRRTEVLAPGERVAIDCWTVQLMTMKLPAEFWDGMPDELVNKLGALRLCLCVAICEATRVVLGARLSVYANAETALRTLSMVCRDKTDLARWADCRRTWHHACTPETVPSDGGSEFIDVNVRCAVRDIGAANEVGPGKHPDARAIGERFFGTLHSQVMQFFQGRTYSSVADRGDYDPAAFKNVVATTLNKAFIKYIVDGYHLAPHGGLGGQSPNEAWAERTARYQVMPPPRPITLRVVFGFADNRRIQSYGVRFLGLWYWSEALGRLRMAIGQQDICMRADLDNIGAISVRRNRPGEPWFTVPCVTPMENVSAREMMETTRRIRDARADATAVDEADFLAAMATIRRMGLQSAASAGLGPSTLSREEVLAHERKHTRHFGIVVAEERGLALRGEDLVDGEDVGGIKPVDAAPPAVPNPDERNSGLVRESADALDRASPPVPGQADPVSGLDRRRAQKDDRTAPPTPGPDGHGGSTRRRRPPTGSSFLKG